MKNTFTESDKIGVQIADLTQGLAVTYGTTTIISHDVVKAYLYNKYGDFYCSDVVTKFNVYNSLQSGDLLKAVNASDAEYDPIENYHGIEKRESISNYGNTTDTRETDSDHNTVTSAALDGTYTETKTTTDTSDTYRSQNKDETHGGTVTTDDLKTTNTKSRGTAELTTVDGHALNGNDVHADLLEKYGNMGVTSTQNLIKQEFDLRLYDVVRKNYLDLFVYQYASYVGGAWS